MSIKTISYGQTKNLGNYQSERLDITVELEEGDDAIEKIQEVKVLVMSQLYPSSSEASHEPSDF